MNDAVEDAVTHGRVRETGEPIGNRNLGGDEGGDAPEAIVKDFEQILGLGSGNGVAHPIVKDEQIKFGQAGQEGREGAILARLGQLEKQTRGAEVAHGIIVAAGGQSQGAGEKGFPGAGGSENERVQMAANPGALGQFEEKAAFQTTSGGEIQIFDAGSLGKTGLLDPALDAPGIATGTFAVDQQRQAFFKG